MLEQSLAEAPVVEGAEGVLQAERMHAPRMDHATLGDL